ncbi:hypothetical protein [Streptomyces sp. HD]|uniref:hypothetical protein n=1 Tax=Streptomyces sp. HD TaxID=3020892 RepID=UPI00232ADF39|nr:hypothetical protein [Streptomyces sp. HD]MDC0773362.1 hypothetical protein [Streptomyces sp. HD]
MRTRGPSDVERSTCPPPTTHPALPDHRPWRQTAVRHQVGAGNDASDTKVSGGA